MIKTLTLQKLGSALRTAAPELNNLTVDDTILSGLKLERPRNPEHGDYAVNVSFLARQTKMPPPKIAEIIGRHWATDPTASEGFELNIIGGYLNVKITDPLLQNTLAALVHSEKPGLNESLHAEKILLEYVSANPTGPLHIGHGRWAALGDSLVRIFRHCGAFVTPEFYINDFGFQMEKLALSVWWRAVELLKNENALDGVDPAKDLLAGRELPYAGEFVVDLASVYLRDAAQRDAVLADWQSYQATRTAFGCGAYDISELSDWGQSIKQRVIDAVAPRILASQQKLLAEMRVHFEVWTSEKQALYQSGAVEETLTALQKQGYTFENEGALWFRSSEFGDEKDRVLKKSDGSYTYLAADIAYHDAKFHRLIGDGQTYNRIMNIWGADHHGYIARMQGAIQALGHNADQFEVLLGQLVNLIIDGERTRMGKRRKMLTLQDVVDEVGVDATRFWMVSKSADSALDFDVDLAASASSENPVFYVQYAHARCCSIFRNATEPAPNVDTGEIHPPYVDSATLQRYEQALTPEALAPLFAALTEERDKAVLKALILLLDGFEDMVKDAARMRAPHFLTQYMMDVSAQFHSFYNVCRILTPEPGITQVRLMLIRAIQKTLAQALALLGVSAPEKM
jgi:arginyl-tRNA synthetase